ncbi:MAG TPA: hypothetical protein PKA20_27550 [Burkholderiaceae bacterium]|nr:hypothetical protein [Burkholderiaceae bacterium]
MNPWAVFSPWAVWQPWLKLQQMLWQTAWAAPQVVMMRLADLGAAPWLWNTRQRSEAARMVSEKGAAFNAGLLAAGRLLTSASPRDHLLTVKLATAGLAPARRRVGANLSRLRGRHARRIAPHSAARRR